MIRGGPKPSPRVHPNTGIVKMVGQKIAALSRLSRDEMLRPDGIRNAEAYALRRLRDTLSREGRLYAESAVRVIWTCEAEVMGYDVPEGVTELEDWEALQRAVDRAAADQALGHLYHRLNLTPPKKETLS